MRKKSTGKKGRRSTERDFAPEVFLMSLRLKPSVCGTPYFGALRVVSEPPKYSSRLACGAHMVAGKVS